MENSMIEINVNKKLISANGPIHLKIQMNLELREIAVLFGSSGSGKTSLLRMLSGLTTPDCGTIAYKGKYWFHSEKKINLTPGKRNIGFMFQDYALFPNMTVSQNISYAQKERDHKKVANLLDLFGLTEFAYRKPDKLSGGQKQRVALAMAIAHEPEILLLDEPLSAIDQTLRSQLQDEVQKVHQRYNTTTVLVSHDLAEVFRLGQRVFLLDQGSIVKYGSPFDVFVDQQIGGKVQITGTLVNIEPLDTLYLLTIVTGMSQVIRVTAFESDMENLSLGNKVMVFTKAFNPMVRKIF